MGYVLIHAPWLYVRDEISLVPELACGHPWLYHGVDSLSPYPFPSFRKKAEWMVAFPFHRPGTHVSPAAVSSLDAAHSAHPVCEKAQSPFCPGLECVSYLSFILYIESPFSLQDPKRRQAPTFLLRLDGLSLSLCFSLLI